MDDVTLFATFTATAYPSDSPCNVSGLDSGSFYPYVVATAISTIIATAFIVIPLVVAPSRVDLDKSSAYECGFDAFGEVCTCGHQLVTANCRLTYLKVLFWREHLVEKCTKRLPPASHPRPLLLTAIICIFTACITIPHAPLSSHIAFATC